MTAVSFLCPQAIKESATELLFGGHETTASTATSLIMFLGLNPQVVDRLRQELMDKVIHSGPQATVLKMFPRVHCGDMQVFSFK